jgi:Zn-dependent M28 family amino/carboxypeptidase
MTKNIIGIIWGSNHTLDHIVVCAHHDHLGRSKDGNQIFHGADDNGSGTAALIEMSRVAKLASIKGFKPKRTIVFISFDSEEFGLNGSDFYVNNPILPLNKILCNVNLDMIGRIDSLHVANKKQNDKYIYCIYKDSTKKVISKSYLNSINSSYTHLILDDYYEQSSENCRWTGIVSRSDHYSFLKRGVPVVWLFSGLHVDYHKPTDTADKINYPLLRKRVQFALALVYDLANK